MKFILLFLSAVILLLANEKENIFTLYKLEKYDKAYQLCFINLKKKSVYKFIGQNNVKIGCKLCLISTRSSNNVLIENFINWS